MAGRQSQSGSHLKKKKPSKIIIARPNQTFELDCWVIFLLYHEFTILSMGGDHLNRLGGPFGEAGKLGGGGVIRAEDVLDVGFAVSDV